MAEYSSKSTAVFLLLAACGLLLTACGGSGSASNGDDGGGSASYLVSTSAGANGSITPVSVIVDENATAVFTLDADTGFGIEAVSGCGGSLAGNIYTTAAITADCTISVSFDSIIANAVAVTAEVVDFARASQVRLDGSASTDPDGDSLTYKWVQTGGVDVTDGTGVFTASTAEFITPSDIGTLFFEFTVNDGNGDSAPVKVQVNVLEHTGTALYVDGDNGSDTTGDGSRALPFATLSKALASIAGTDVDIYIKTSVNGYQESGATLMIPKGTSLYGGYGDNWVRKDISQNNNRTLLLGSEQAVHFVDVDYARFSGFRLRTTKGFFPAPYSTIGLSAQGNAATGTLIVQDNFIYASDVLVTSSDAPTDSYGLRLADLAIVRVRRNGILSGAGGNGVDGAAGYSAPDSENGANASGQTGGNRSTTIGGRSGCLLTFTTPDCPGSLRPASQHGGPGGKGGDKNGGNGSDGENGRKADDGTSNTGASGGAGGYGGSSTNSGGDGNGGRGGEGGNGGRGGNGIGTLSAGFYINNSARNGQNGQHAVGGGGGGGGEGGSLLTGNKVGGGGGGGGAGGVGGEGGKAGGRGGASIGILLDNIAYAEIDSNVVTSSNGGTGGAGGGSARGSFGGNGGKGRAKIEDGEAGGDGGGGGRGGESGEGGAGGGGPSYSILIGANMSPVITNNTLISGNGGAPGPDGTGINGGARGGRDGVDGRKGGSGGTSYKSILRGYDGVLAEGGWSVNIFDANLGDGMTPVLNNNSFVTGTAGNRGSAMQLNY